MWWSRENLLRLVMRCCARPRNRHLSIHTIRLLGLQRLSCLVCLASPALATIFRRLFASTVVAATLASCGFALRGSYELPYNTIQVTSRSNSVVAGLVRRDLADSKTNVVGNAKDAEAALTIIEERRDRQILSLSGAGRVREYELRMKVTYQFVDAKGQVIIPTSEILLKRTFAYDDTRVIAKQQEEAMLYQDMERDATGQILRRMIAVKKAL